MTIDRRSLLAGLACAALPFAGTALAADGPDAVIRDIYKRIVATYVPGQGNANNGSFTWLKDKNRHHYYARSLAVAWDRAYVATAEGDQAPPGADPITNSQDPQVAAFAVSVEQRDAKTARVIVTISDKPGPVARSEGGTITYDMVLERGRWRIDDIRAGTGAGAWSLRKEIINHKG